MRSTKPRMTPYLVFSLLLFCACATIEKPHTYLGIVNAPGQRMKGYWLDKDLTSDGYLKAGAVPEYRRAASVQDLNKYACTDPDGLAELKRYIKQLREKYENECQRKMK